MPSSPTMVDSSSVEKFEGEATGHGQVLPPERNTQPGLRGDPRVWRPWAIFLGPLPVLVFCWAFFAVTWDNPIAVPDYLASTIRNHSQSSTMVVSVVATLLASWTAYFFASAVRYVIAIHLAVYYTSLHVLTAATRIASKSLWFSDPRMKWTWIVGLSWIAVSLQTSSLTSLLTIREIQVLTPVSGFGFNMNDPQVIQVASVRPEFPDFYNEVSSFFLQSIMTNALELKRNISGTFNFDGYTYTSTTGGIRPSSFVEIKNTNLATSNSSTVPANLDDIRKARHNNLPFNKIMVLQQQGFTADVSCRLNNPQDLELYPGSLVEGPIPGLNMTIAALTVRCPGQSTNATSVRPVAYLDPQISSGSIGALFAVKCPIPNTFSYAFIVKAVGSYAVLDQTVCTVVPKVTTVNVEYRYSGGYTEVPTTISVSEPLTKADVPIWGEMALNMLLFNVVLGQGTIGSTIANAWLLTVGANPEGITVTEALNTYIRAAVEFSGTVARYLFTQSDSRYIPGGWNSLTPSMRSPVNGTFYATTYGWGQDHTVSPLFLLPITVIVLATYALLGYGVLLAKDHKHEFLEEDAHFDPTDIVHITAAHTPGTRGDELKRFSDPTRGYSQRTRVRMRTNNELSVRVLEVMRDGDGQNGSDLEGRTVQ